MDVYVEYVFIDNFAVDFIIGFLTLRILKLPFSPARVSLSAAMGTAAAFLLPLINLPAVLSFLLKGASGAAMAFALSPRGGFKAAALRFTVFLFVSFVLGGAALGAFFLTGTDARGAVTLNYTAGVPVGVIAAALAVVCYFAVGLIKYIHKSRDLSPFIRRVRLYAAGREIETYALIDSGNRLYHGGLPVIVVNADLFGKTKSERRGRRVGAANDSESGEKEGDAGRGFIDVASVGGTSRLPVIDLEKILIYSDKGANTIYGVAAALKPGGFKDAARYECLLHPALV